MGKRYVSNDSEFPGNVGVWGVGGLRVGRGVQVPVWVHAAQSAKGLGL